jgi:ribosomal protein S18 acetylase RimI-like enzyme
MELTIQKAKEEEYVALREIFFKARQEHFHWMERSLIHLSDFDKETEGEIILAARLNNKTVGFVSVWEADKFIHHLFVSSDCRGYGIGKALLDEAARQVGMPLTLKCVKENTNAMNFYLSQNWRIEKEELDVEWPYYVMIYDEGE